MATSCNFSQNEHILFEKESKNCSSNFKHQREIQNYLNKFQEALFKKDKTEISNLLEDSGEFDIQNEINKTIIAGKETFLKWFLPILDSTQINSIKIDHCLFCKIGNPVLLINHGSIPKKINSITEKERTGLMLEFAKEKIIGITFCYTFFKNENQTTFEQNINKIRKLEDQGISKKDAFLLVLGIEFSEDLFQIN